jgi:hypothetical protein
MTKSIHEAAEVAERRGDDGDSFEGFFPAYKIAQAVLETAAPCHNGVQRAPLQS